MWRAKPEELRAIAFYFGVRQLRAIAFYLGVRHLTAANLCNRATDLLAQIDKIKEQRGVLGRAPIIEEALRLYIEAKQGT